jgi:hypothetical protein
VPTLMSKQPRALGAATLVEAAARGVVVVDVVLSWSGAGVEVAAHELRAHRCVV